MDGQQFIQQNYLQNLDNAYSHKMLFSKEIFQHYLQNLSKISIQFKIATTIEAYCIDDEQKDYLKNISEQDFFFFSFLQKLNCRVNIFVEFYMN